MRVCEGCGKELVRKGQQERPSEFLKRRFCNPQCCGAHRRSLRLINVWNHIAQGDACWTWLGPTNSRGYGVFCNILAHRYVWELHNGPIPAGLSALHKCDNPICVNPDHIFLGTRADNIKDMDEKNRRVTLHGEDHAFSKLKESDVIHILDQLTKGVPTGDIAASYNVCKATIAHIKTGRTWRHIIRQRITTNHNIGPRLKTRKYDIPVEELAGMLKAGMTPYGISQHYGCSQKVILIRIKDNPRILGE